MWFLPDLGLRQLSHKRADLCRTTCPHPRSTLQGARDCQDQLFAPPRSGEHTISLSGASMGVTVESAHQRHVSCQLRPPRERQSICHDLQQRPSAASPAHDLLPPTLVAALSSANSRRNGPALAHAARWWPNGSIGRPHLHGCWDNGSGEAAQQHPEPCFLQAHSETAPTPESGLPL